ncbi:DHS-like NAD/FAD-binding domain-containing protein [Pisolithus croceorrhizus]|nr:DHS-like NAD/FAD-binding domain-containing protein [Pisolithus croceorrhizus]KAI6117758.1 DHS-like NAD/FAD-binding domain-containing protein [Pisolithus croceorrhizus]KAI6159743.1 DHS-like NAD/FAD-binding domain-containing protein [Pisolithus thermaeus]
MSTIFLPLDDIRPPQSTSSFLVHVDNPRGRLQDVIGSILSAKRLVVVCGAGISVQAGIPDFRSQEGLFRILKKDNQKEGLTSGRDLFDVSVFNSAHTTSLFCQMIAQLSELSQRARSTPFHELLQWLDERGSLLRVYTQNIDAIEHKSGLSFGIPEAEDKRYRPRCSMMTSVAGAHQLDATPPSTPMFMSHQPLTLHPKSRRRSPTLKVPRCIPLHGTIQTLYCQRCMHTCPLECYIDSLTLGTLPYCPECTQSESARQLAGKRTRGIGKLRPSVVLYNESHKDGEAVGEVVMKDLLGRGKSRSGADVLLVVGTSLQVPGTRRIVRQFSKAVRSHHSHARGTLPFPVNLDSSMVELQPIKSIFLNLHFPVPSREWEGVFDAWVQGDVQTFAQMMMDRMVREMPDKEAAIGRKRNWLEVSNGVDLVESTAADQDCRSPSKKKVKEMESLRADYPPSRCPKDDSGSKGCSRGSPQGFRGGRWEMLGKQENSVFSLQDRRGRKWTILERHRVVVGLFPKPRGRRWATLGEPEVVRSSLRRPRDGNWTTLL